jgi:hypothetical protein
MRVPPGLELVRDVSVGEWLNGRLLPLRGTDEGVLVGEIVPTGFETYARILHPALLPRDGELVPVRWSELAAERGKVIHPEAQLASLLGEELPTGGNSWGEGFVPEEGSLPEGQCGALASILAGFTSTPDLCWFCVWEGFGFWHGGSSLWSTTRIGAAGGPAQAPGAPPIAGSIEGSGDDPHTGSAARGPGRATAPWLLSELLPFPGSDRGRA